MKKTGKLVMLLLILCLFTAGCSKEAAKKEMQLPAQGDGELATTVDYDFAEGKTISPLTGELVDEDVANNRVVACMINNIDVAMPQSGISYADIVYECVVEGGITRLMGIFQDYKNIPKLGPVRSARHYYVDYANEYDAIYAHFGQTKYAVSEMEALNTDELSGLSAMGSVVYYRDNSRVAPHNAYTDGKKIVKGIKKSKFEKKNTLPDSRFDFNVEQQELTAEDAKKANIVKLTFNGYSHPYFQYNKKDGLYYRWQYNAKHIDDQTGEQLCYENIIVQFADYSDIDKKGYQDLNLVSSGDGYYISEGKYIPITWEKKSKSEYTNFYTADGQALKVNSGKTWISVFPSNNKKGVSFKEKE